MGKKSLIRVAVPLVAAACACALSSQARAGTTVYAGNGATGFGGPVGTGTLSVSDATYTDPTTMATSPGVTIAFTPGAIHGSLDGNNLVIYVATGAPGIADTSTLIDTGSPAGSDFGHVAISGYNNFNNGGQTTPTRTEVAFPTGFNASYAFSYANAYDGLFSLPTDGSGLLGYVGGASPVNDDNTLTIPLSYLGLTPGQSFSFVATDIDGSSAYRSNETIGDAVLNPDPATGDPGTDLALDGNPGFTNLIQFTSSDTFTTAGTVSTPEPASLAVLAVGGLLSIRRRRSNA